MSQSSNSGPTVNVADQGDGPLSVDQTVEVGPSSNPGPLVSAANKGGQPANSQTVGPSSNPGPRVNVADQGDGETSVDQAVEVGPSSNPGPLVSADAEGLVEPLSVDQAVEVGPSQNSATSKTASNMPGEIVEPGVTNAGTYSPQNAKVANVTQNNVVGQTYGTGTPKDVYV